MLNIVCSYIGACDSAGYIRRQRHRVSDSVAPTATPAGGRAYQTQLRARRRQRRRRQRSRRRYLRDRGQTSSNVGRTTSNVGRVRPVSISQHGHPTLGSKRIFARLRSQPTPISASVRSGPTWLSLPFCCTTGKIVFGTDATGKIVFGTD